MLPGDDVDDTRNGIGAVEGGRRSLDDFDALYVVWVYQRELVLASIVTMQPASVYENQHV